MKRRGCEHRRGEGSKTLSERKDGLLEGEQGFSDALFCFFNLLISEESLLTKQILSYLL